MINRWNILLASAALLLGSCGEKSDGGAVDTGKPVAVATTTMIADMVTAIAGEDFEVKGLMPSGVDPHTYELPARATGLLRSADAVIYNGLHLEGKMSEVFGPLAEQGIVVVELGRAVDASLLITAENFDIGSSDPHIWGDASLWKATVKPVVAALSEVLPEKKADFEARGAAYEKEIGALHEWIRSRIGEVPVENRVLITSHDAFSYLGKAYDIDVVGVQGVSTASEAGMADLVNMKDLVKKRGVKAIFTESSVSQANIESIARDSGVKIGGTLYSDSCGPLGTEETVNGETYDVGTYFGMMKHNINTIVDALK